MRALDRRVHGRSPSDPDHGDLWDVPFAVEDSLVWAIGTSLDYRFERRIEPTAGGLRLSYTATARSVSIPFLWAAHPQFLAPPGTWVEVPGLASAEEVLIEPRRPIPWTSELATIDTVPEGAAARCTPRPTGSSLPPISYGRTAGASA